MASPTYSIVVPVFNEAESLPELHRRLTTVMEKLGEPWELILVNDGSSDASPTVMRDLAAHDPHVRVLRFARNFGHQIAVTAGLDASKGRVKWEGGGRGGRRNGGGDRPPSRPG